MSFGKIVKLEKEFRSAPNVITTHLDGMLPQAIATVLDQTLPSKLVTALQVTIPPTLKTILDDTLATALQDTISPTLKTVLDDTISDTLFSVLDSTFSEFTKKVESMGTDMAQAVRALVASAEGPLLECYAAIKEEYSACKTRLDEVLDLLSTQTDLPTLAPVFHTPPDNPGGDAMGPSCPPPFDNGGNAPHAAPSACMDSSPVVVHGGVQHHPSFLQGRIEDFDFYHNPERASACSDGPPSGGAYARFPPHNGQVCFPPLSIDTDGDTVPGGKITTPCFTDRSHVA